ncbi:MAG: hypothetical protein KGZ79_06305 [Dethiobacter sp.]|nr:hypothetical protein [Dethiobacter sp.]
MSSGSYCENCGFHTDKIMVICPRCCHALRHAQCSKCGRCPDDARQDKLSKVKPKRQ